MKTTVQLTVNGEQYRVDVPPLKRLLDVLREDLHLTGMKEGCGEGECGGLGLGTEGIVPGVFILIDHGARRFNLFGTPGQ